MSLYQNQIIRAYTITKHKAHNEEDMIRIKKVKKVLKDKHARMKKNLKKLKKLDEKENKKQERFLSLNEMEEHKYSLDELAQNFHVDLAKGLSQQKAQILLQRNGLNKLSGINEKNQVLLFFQQMSDPFSLFMWLLTVLSVITFIISKDNNALFLAIIIFITIITSAILAFVFTKSSQDILKQLHDIVPKYANVRRNGVIKNVVTEELVVGDIIVIEPGQIIPADIRIIQSNGMKVNNSIFTGQVELKEICAECTNQNNPFESRNIVYSGFINERGDGKGIVIRTGQNTFLAHLSDLLVSCQKKSTSIENQISRYVKIMTFFAVSIGIFVLFAGVLIGYPWIIAAMIAIGVTIASAPGILNLQVTILLTMAIKRLAKNQIICKNLHVIEELGSTTCLCSDKTGTITSNKMSVSHLYLNGKKYHKNQILENKQKFENMHLQQLMKCAILSSTAIFINSVPLLQIKKIYSRTDISQQEKKKQQVKLKEKWNQDFDKKSVNQVSTYGDPTESALIRFFQQIQNIQKMRHQFPTKREDGHDFHFRFDPSNKYSYSICHEETENSHYSLFIKGAPEIIWKKCSKVLKNKKTINKGPIEEQHFEDFIRLCGKKSERILGFAKMYYPKDDYHKTYKFKLNNKKMNNLIFLGMVSLFDPPKKGIDETMLRLKAAGIKVVMITGDQDITATAVARQTNIIQQPKTVNEIMVEQQMDFHTAFPYSEAVVINGQDLINMNIQDQALPISQKGKKLQKILEKREVIFARTNPSQKLMIVQALKKMNHVVTVTGDGINDSPAVKFSDAGIAMGSGADATRDAADIIIVDDDLNRILEGVQEGRKLFDNLKKSICYVMTSQVSEWAPFILLIVARIPIPIFTLLIDGTADFVPAISYAFEHGQVGIMTRKPRSRQEHLVTYKLILQCNGWMGWSSFLCSLLCFFICMADFGFIPNGLWGKNNIDILIPGSNDYYNPTSPYFGNSELQKIQNCDQFITKTQKIDWINSLHPEVDLRMAAVTCTDTKTGPVYEHNLPFGECRIQQISVITHKPVCFTTEAAKYGQTSYMYANVVNQMFNLFICKTRRQSIFSQRMDNTVIYFGLIIEVMLALALNQTLFMIELIGTRDTIFMHYGLGAIPFGIIQLILDQIRKYLIRTLPADNMGDQHRKVDQCKPNWFQRNTMW